MWLVGSRLVGVDTIDWPENGLDMACRGPIPFFPHMPDPLSSWTCPGLMLYVVPTPDQLEWVLLMTHILDWPEQ